MLEIVRRSGDYDLIFTNGTINGHTSNGWTLAQALRDSILRKLAVNDRAQAVIYAFRNGWIKLTEEQTTTLIR